MKLDCLASGILSLKTALPLVLSGPFLFVAYSAHAGDALFTKPLEQYTAYPERPLFTPARRAPTIETAPAKNEAPVSVPSLNATLLGVISGNDGLAIVMVRLDGQNEIQRIHLGESLEGWTFERLEGRDVVFASGDQKTVLTFPIVPNATTEPDDANPQADPPPSPVMPTGLP